MTRSVTAGLMLGAVLGMRPFSISEDQAVRVTTDFSLNIVPNRGISAPTGDDPRHREPLR